MPEDERGRQKREARGELPAPKLAAADVAATFQEAAIGAIELKLERAMGRFPECRTLLVGGGVSANGLLRERVGMLCAKRGVDLRLSPLGYCMDNAAMIAALGHDLLTAREGVGDGLEMTATPTV